MTATTVYYKATRHDGTDFRTGRVLYEVGQVVKHPVSKRFGDMHPNDPSTYLSASVEAGEVLIGGWWPCRVVRVEPVGRTVKRTDGRYPYKRGCRAMLVVEELPAHVAFGPNGEAVAELIDLAGSLTPDQARQLNAAGAAAWDAALGAAGDAAMAAAGDAAMAAARGAAGVAAWDASRTAAGVAAIALLCRDLITETQFETLYGPWMAVMGAER